MFLTFKLAQNDILVSQPLFSNILEYLQFRYYSYLTLILVCWFIVANFIAGQGVRPQLCNLSSSREVNNTSKTPFIILQLTLKTTGGKLIMYPWLETKIIEQIPSFYCPIWLHSKGSLLTSVKKNPPIAEITQVLKMQKHEVTLTFLFCEQVHFVNLLSYD